MYKRIDSLKPFCIMLKGDYETKNKLVVWESEGQLQVFSKNQHNGTYIK